MVNYITKEKFEEYKQNVEKIRELESESVGYKITKTLNILFGAGFTGATIGFIPWNLPLGLVFGGSAAFQWGIYYCIHKKDKKLCNEISELENKLE